MRGILSLSLPTEFTDDRGALCCYSSRATSFDSEKTCYGQVARLMILVRVLYSLMILVSMVIIVYGPVAKECLMVQMLVSYESDVLYIRTYVRTYAFLILVVVSYAPTIFDVWSLCVFSYVHLGLSLVQTSSRSIHRRIVIHVFSVTLLLVQHVHVEWVRIARKK